VHSYQHGKQHIPGISAARDTDSYDISNIPRVMRRCLDFCERRHDSAFINLVEEETVYYYRMLRCWPDTTMAEIYDAIAQVEGWKPKRCRISLNSQGDCRANDIIGNGRHACLGNISVSLFLNWPDPCDTTSDDGSGGSDDESESSFNNDDDSEIEDAIETTSP